MKKLGLLMVVLYSMSSAQLLTDDFDYSGNLNANGWDVHSGAASNVIATTTGLTYSGYTNSGIGNAALVKNTGGEDVNRALDSTLSTQGDVIYVSMLVQVTDAASSKTGDYVFHIGNRASASSFTLFAARLGVKITSDVVNFGISNTATISYGTTGFAKNTTYLVIIKYTINTSGSDTVKLWVKSSGVPSDEGTAGTVEASSTTTLGQDIINAIALRQGSSTNSPQVVIDGIRVATTWGNAPLPVELTSFTAMTNGRGVELAWKTATETNNAGFEVEKNISGIWNKIGFVEGAGTSNAPKSYTFVDASAKGNVSYRLKQIDRDGKFEYSSVVEAAVALTAGDYSLTQNYPNPFNPSTSFTFAVQNQEQVNVTVYNALGQAVATLFNGIAAPNELYTLTFNAKDLSSGTYFYALRSATRNEVRKMSLVK